MIPSRRETPKGPMQRSGTWIIATLIALAALWLAVVPASASTAPRAGPASDMTRARVPDAGVVARLAPQAPAPGPRAIPAAQAADETSDPDDDDVAAARPRPPAVPGTIARRLASTGLAGPARPRSRRPATGPPAA